MDMFGIGNALQANAELLFQMCRRTGRTTIMLSSLKDGDRVIVLDQTEGVRLKRLLAEQRLNVEILVCPPDCWYTLAGRPKSIGRTVMSHEFVEAFYRSAMKQAACDLDMVASRLSGDSSTLRATPIKSFVDWRIE